MHDWRAEAEALKEAILAPAQCTGSPSRSKTLLVGIGFDTAESAPPRASLNGNNAAETHIQLICSPGDGRVEKDERLVVQELQRQGACEHGTRLGSGIAESSCSLVLRCANWRHFQTPLCADPAVTERCRVRKYSAAPDSTARKDG